MAIFRGLNGARLLLPSSPSTSSPFSPFKLPLLPPPPAPSSSSLSPPPRSYSLLTFTRVVAGVTNQNIPGSAAQAFSQQKQDNKRKLVLYSKPECCLCENLKEKLNLVFNMDSDSTSGRNPLSDIQLEVRNITTNAEWEAAYQYEIPVLAWVNEDGTERMLPRLSPRLSVELIQKKLVAAISF